MTERGDAAYGEDLAYVHDRGFGDLARHASGVVRDALAERDLRDGIVIDLGCGSGILAEELTGAGFDVLGVDISEAMIEQARRRTPRGRFVVGSAFSTPILPCVAVTAIGECFNYLFDASNDAAALRDLFARVHEALRPGGVLVCDVATPGRAPNGEVLRVHSEGDDWAVLATIEEDAASRTLTRRITTFRKDGEAFRRSREVHRVRLIPEAELVDALERIGFEVRRLAGYGATPFPKGLVGVVARRG